MSWQNLTREYNLPQRYNSRKLDRHQVPACYLPLSFHAELFKSSWRAADVYTDNVYQTRETTGFHVLKPLMLSLLALFHGRLVDNSARRIAQEKEPWMGEITHKVLAMGDTIFVILEVDLLAPREEESVALLFEQLISAAQDTQPSASQVRIYGLLTDRTRFAFFSYDPSQRRFSFDQEYLASGPREQYLTRLIPIANKIFSVLLAGYLAVLQAPVAAEATDEHGNTRIAVRYAILATEQFTSGTSDEASDMDLCGEQALQLLETSVLAVQRNVNAYMEVQEPQSAKELEDLASHLVLEWHEKNLLTLSSK
ncbi:hypothetical protein C8Q73DRAFT_259164 [Cubamyces lactineus]|nr:hypothetical protein C8Q73DRAFT_259164 [Cubamyces lactineus]